MDFKFIISTDCLKIIEFNPIFLHFFLKNEELNCGIYNNNLNIDFVNI